MIDTIIGLTAGTLLAVAANAEATWRLTRPLNRYLSLLDESVRSVTTCPKCRADCSRSEQ